MRHLTLVDQLPTIDDGVVAYRLDVHVGQPLRHWEERLPLITSLQEKLGYRTEFQSEPLILSPIHRGIAAHGHPIAPVAAANTPEHLTAADSEVDDRTVAIEPRL